MKGLYADDYITSEEQMICLNCPKPENKCNGECRRLKELKKQREKQPKWNITKDLKTCQH